LNVKILCAAFLLALAAMLVFCAVTAPAEAKVENETGSQYTTTSSLNNPKADWEIWWTPYYWIMYIY
jgi:hypothetical protein